MNSSIATCTNEKAPCPRCGGERNCETLGLHDEKWYWTDGRHDASGVVEHRSLKCRGCDQVFHLKSSWDDQSYEPYYDADGNVEYETIKTIETWPPKPSKARPEWMANLFKHDSALSLLMAETYTARDAGSYILASVGLRTALDRCSDIANIDPAMTLSEKVDELLKGGWVGDTEAATLRIVVDAGGAAAHRGWNPDADDFDPLLQVMEQFIGRAIVSGKNAMEIAQRIPPKPKRRKKAANGEIAPKSGVGIIDDSTCHG